MAWIDDFSVDFATTGNIRHVSGATRYPTIDMHRALISMAYAAANSGDDVGNITDLIVPSRRASDTDITLNGLLNIDDTAAEFMYGGSVTFDSGAEKYSGLALGGKYSATSLPQLFQNNLKLTSYWGFSFSPNVELGYAVQILVKSRTAGVDIDGGRIRLQARGYNHPSGEAATVLGSNVSVVGLGDVSILDSFNGVASATISGYTDIVNTEGYQQIDYANGNGDNPFYMHWSKGSRGEADVYNRIKYETRDGTAETLYGLNGEFFRGITHEIDVDTPAGTLIDGAAITWATGTGQLLTMDSPTAATKVWIQLLTGVAPTDNDVLTAGGTVVVNIAVLDIALGSASVAGNYTGSWIGVKGAAQAVADVGSADSFTDLDGGTQAPPNLQGATVNGMVATEDKVVLGKSLNGTDIDKTEFTAAAGNTSGNGTFVVNEVITNIPTTGFVNVNDGNASGIEESYEYSSFTGSTFTLVGTLSKTYTNGDASYPLIFNEVATSSTESRAWIYTADVLVVGQVVDDGSVNNTPTVIFPITGTFGSGGFSANIVRQDDF